MTNYLALNIFLAFVFSLLLALWAWRQQRAALPLVLAAVGVTAITSALIVAGSTELVGTPWFQFSIAEFTTNLAPAVFAAFTVVGLALLYVIVGQPRAKKQGAQTWPRPLSAWAIGVALISAAALFVLPPSFSTIAAEPAAEEELDVPAEEVPLLVAAADTLPEGFELHAVLPEAALERPVSFTLGPNGELFISTYFGGIYTLAAGPWDPQAASLVSFAPEIPQITGMVYLDGSLYANGSGSLYKLTDTNGDGAVDETETLLSDLPSRIYDHHSNNSLVLGPDGRFFFGLGGTTDHGPEEHPLAGSILTYDLATGDLEVFARGLRNSYDQAFCPFADGPLFATDNGPDAFDEALRILPPDELNLVEEGKNYGYPTDFGYPAPWVDTIAPIALMETSGVPAGIVCYEAAGARLAFPAEYEQDLFVALAGGSNPVTGHKIVHVQVTERDGHPYGEVTDFLTGLGRPVDILLYTDGSLLILDYDLGQIYQVVYTGS